MLTQTESRATVAERRFDLWWFVAVGSVVMAVLVASLFAPDMVTGSSHEHLPMAGMTDWLWGLIAVGYLAFVRRDRADITFGLSVALLWTAVALTSVFAAPMVTGTDPTEIPIAAMVAPIVGCLATGFLSINAVRQRDG